jgi:hypothetical protein
MLVVDVLSVGNSSASADMGFRLLPVPPKNGTLPGFALVPFGQTWGEIEKDLGEGWTFNADISAEAEWIFRAMPKRGGGVHTDRGAGEGDKEFRAEATLSFDPADDPEGRTVLNDGEGSAIRVNYFQARVLVHSTTDKTQVVVEVPAAGRFEAEPGGGFLGTVMPDGIQYDFDTTVGYDSESGLYFERGGTLEASIPLSKSLGPISLSELYSELDPGAGGGGGGAGAARAAARSTARQRGRST